MKYRKLIQIAATISAMLMALFASATPLAAQGNTPKHSHYRVVDLGTLGGPNTDYEFGSRIINRSGVVVGGSDTFDEACGCFAGRTAASSAI